MNIRLTVAEQIQNSWERFSDYQYYDEYLANYIENTEYFNENREFKRPHISTIINAIIFYIIVISVVIFVALLRIISISNIHEINKFKTIRFSNLTTSDHITLVIASLLIIVITWGMAKLIISNIKGAYINKTEQIINCAEAIVDDVFDKKILFDKNDFEKRVNNNGGVVFYSTFINTKKYKDKLEEHKFIIAKIGHEEYLVMADSCKNMVINKGSSIYLYTIDTDRIIRAIIL